MLPSAVTSLWLTEALDGPDCPPLTGAESCDVCVVGGGFTGLWTALRLKELDSVSGAYIRSDAPEAPVGRKDRVWV